MKRDDTGRLPTTMAREGQERNHVIGRMEDVGAQPPEQAGQSKLVRGREHAVRDGYRANVPARCRPEFRLEAIAKRSVAKEQLILGIRVDIRQCADQFAGVLADTRNFRENPTGVHDDSHEATFL